ncbi:nucleotide exchange factor GrpE [Bradyrhizobium viridifuturi]|nr:nucleotide exchange factor GrpE [Bradyrhizobium viridifuturi]ERF83138.1 MAG: molecular chaperone GrpE [Bradyrhizobium sp. DFCI-1]MCA3793662.1 nucleotide exchange factor GrpE [Burkholderia sp.]QRI71399.1 nucleotide exchange factor GrpE [Bradyrhizobium sp. PSBB068]MBR1023682.1 nucleotide exchange factor GrpE [Bradyrhizobium viridifuturi]MBR1040478.1 nucleotide exchange factor GrpE [Bradyrhizobium viridifuturi]
MPTKTVDDVLGEVLAGEHRESDQAQETSAERDRLMRALADAENTRRMAERRVQDARQYAIADFARELLQVADNLRRAIDASSPDQGVKNDDGLLAGVVATDRILTQILKRFGVEEIDALNRPFDPMKHEAVMETDRSDQPPGNVVDLLENGYMLHDRLLRPARVVVARPPKPQSPPPPQQ